MNALRYFKLLTGITCAKDVLRPVFVQKSLLQQTNAY